MKKAIKLILILMLVKLTAFAQNPVVISNPYLFQKYITIHDSINTMNNGSDTIASRRYVRQHSSITIQYWKRTGIILSPLTTGDNINTTGVGAFGLAIPTAFNGLSTTHLYTSPTSAVNEVSSINQLTTTTTNSFSASSLSATLLVMGSNTNNWTNGIGLVGGTYAVNTQSGAIGTITNLGSIRTVFTQNATGSTVTNAYEIKMNTPTISGTVTNFSYLTAGFGAAAGQTAGNYFIDAVNVTYPSVLGGNITAPKFITSGGTTSQFVDGTGALQTISAQYWKRSGATISPLTSGNNLAIDSVAIAKGLTIKDQTLSTSDFYMKSPDGILHIGQVAFGDAMTIDANSGLVDFLGSNINTNSQISTPSLILPANSHSINVLPDAALTHDFIATLPDATTNQNVAYQSYVTSGNHIGVAGLSASGTPSSTTYLRGDNTWATISAGGITALTGDGTASGSGSVALTLATVNSNVGSFGSSTAIPAFTVNAKGLITSASTNVVIAPAGTLSGTTLNSSVVTSSLTSASLSNLTATDATLTFSGSYNGNTARTIGINLDNANTWSGTQTFGFANLTNQSLFQNTFIGGAVTGLQYQSNTTNARSFLAVVPNGTSIGADVWLFSNSNTASNISAIAWGYDQTDVAWGWNTVITGTGTAKPIYFNSGGVGNAATSNLYLPTNGSVVVGGTTGSSKFNVVGSSNLGGLVINASGVITTGTWNGSVLGTAYIGTGTASSGKYVDGASGAWTALPSSFANPMTTLGDIIYGGTSGVATRLAGNTTSVQEFLTQTGTGSASAAPAFFDLFGTANTFTARQTITDGTQGLKIGAWTSGGGRGAIYLASVTPGASNWAFLTGGGFTEIQDVSAQVIGSSNAAIQGGGSVLTITANTANLGAMNLFNAATLNTIGYTVATLPSGTLGMKAYVTDALAPSYMVTIVGGGAIVTPVFYNGTNWVAD